MEIEIIEKSKKKLKFNLKGEDHTFCNILRKELNNDKNVKIAEYRVENSLTSTPVFFVEVESGSPAKALADAVKRVAKQCEVFSNKFKQALK